MIRSLILCMLLSRQNKPAVKYIIVHANNAIDSIWLRGHWAVNWTNISGAWACNWATWTIVAMVMITISFWIVWSCHCLLGINSMMVLIAITMAVTWGGTWWAITAISRNIWNNWTACERVYRRSNWRIRSKWIATVIRMRWSFTVAIVSVTSNRTCDWRRRALFISWWRKKRRVV